MRFFATAAKGTEGALRDELRELRFRGVRADRGGVHFAGEWVEGFRACIELRTAMRVLAEVGRFDAPGGAALYEGVRAIDWRPFFTPRHTLAVRASCRSSALSHTQFIAQKTKDAVVDHLRDALGARPSVDRGDPDVSLFVHLVRDAATVYLDLAGEPLHRRGYRARAGEAPLKETLAAAIVRLSGWDRERPLVDPMCGSGTIPIEAAMWAYDIAPGLARERFGFERWASHDEGAARAVRDLREAARARARSEGPEIVASDADLERVIDARDGARRAGVPIQVAKRSLRDLAPTTPPGVVVTNPPYGARIEAGEALHRDLGDAVRRLRGHRFAILAGTPAILRAIPMRPERTLTIYNGAIECRLATYVAP